jgi:hypothetical protein
MRLALHELLDVHGALRGHPVDYPRCGALALERSGHSSPVRTATEHDDRRGQVMIEWLSHDPEALIAVDEHRLTEDAAEAVALAYVNVAGEWVVKRRLRRGEYADWLLLSAGRWLALEVSGTTTSDSRGRLAEKREQVARCTLPATRMALVVGFQQPVILAETL